MKHDGESLVESVERMIAECREHFRQTFEYLYTKADFMLELGVGCSRPGLFCLALRLRERPIYRDRRTETDLLELSGIVVPERQIVALLPAFPSTGATIDRERISFCGPGSCSLPFEVYRRDLVKALRRLFVLIGRYEARVIMHVAGYTATGLGRRAHVSVTGMGRLRGFRDPALRQLPPTYHTILEACDPVQLPPLRMGEPAFSLVRRRGS